MSSHDKTALGRLRKVATGLLGLLLTVALGGSGLPRSKYLTFSADAGSEQQRVSVEPSERPLLVLLIVIDTLRADHVGAFGSVRR